MRINSKLGVNYLSFFFSLYLFLNLKHITIIYTLYNIIFYNRRDNPTAEIEIKISKEEKKEEGKKRKYLKIEFIDNGRGIPDARKETIFQRVSNQQRSTSGMGLGLSLVKFIIDSYNGDILVKDKVRGNYTKGSNFIVFVPEAILS